MKKIIIFTSIFLLCACATSAQEINELNLNKIETTKQVEKVSETPNLKSEENLPLQDVSKNFEQDSAPEIDPDSLEAINSYFSELSVDKQISGQIQYSEQVSEEDAAIHLDSVSEDSGIIFTAPKKFGSKSMGKKGTFQPLFSPLDTASKFIAPEYNISPVSSSYSEKFGNFSFGTRYDSSLGNARATYSTAFFAQLEGKYYALTTSFSKSTKNDFGSFNDIISFAPELKLTKRLSLLDVMKTDVYQIRKSNEIVLRYKPNLKKYADDIELEVGAGQYFYEDSYVNSSLRFSTKFKL